MNLLMLFNGSERDFSEYMARIHDECMRAGVDLPEYRFIAPVDLFFRKEALPIILKHTSQYDYIDTPGQGRWGGWHTHLLALIRNFFLGTILKPFRMHAPPKYELAKGAEKKSFHCIILGVKDDKFEKGVGAWEYR